ncbi:carboxynorspermidine decarboxylase [human gut metagenome]|uniref:Carboxynorspermidine decarboxylase n=1 Tax=human gut metagenome TaxID=408170 RepID=K1RTS5_9ZZZZ
MLDIKNIETPCYIIDEKRLISNLEILKYVQNASGCKILLAQKAFSAFSLYPLIGKYISGTACSGLYEARLGYECMGKENHVFSAAYRAEELMKLFLIADILFLIRFPSWNFTVKKY